VLEAIFSLQNDLIFAIYFISLFVIGGAFFTFGGLSVTTQAVYNAKYEAHELSQLSLTFSQGNALFDKFLSCQGNNFYNIQGVEDWNRFVLKELYDAVEDKSKCQERLSFFAERISASVFEDRIAAQLAHLSKEGTFMNGCRCIASTMSF
jgi:hypothetical protein